MRWPKVFKIAGREFASTALTKGFLFGAFVFPLLIFAAMPFVVKLIEKAEQEAPVVTGRMALIDRSGSSGELADRVRLRLEAEDAGAVVPSPPANATPEEALDAAGDTFAALSGRRSVITLETPPDDDEVDALRDELRAAYDESMTGELLALAIVGETAVNEGDEGFGGFDLVHRRKLDDRVIGRMRTAIEASIRDLRYDIAGLDRERLDALWRVGRDVQEVTETGEVQDSTARFGVIMPFVMLILLIMSVMTGGQYLLTTTVEEKTSRVVEVLLSAVSPMELMCGKVLGQMTVGLALLVIYSGLGIAAVAFFGIASGIVTPQMVGLLAIYFLLAYIMLAAFMAAVGAAVNEMREAQSMMMPVGLLVMIPYLLVFPISRDPNSTMATVLSFIPPINPFVMVIRLGSTSPPAMWEHGVAIAVGVVGAWASVWLAAKVFRVGLLMFGKPPNFKTLIKWVRMA
jgi:ABC-2 type transport system permease protein